MIEWVDYQLWRDRIAEAVDERFYPMDWLDARVAHGKVRVWTSDFAVILAEMKEYPSGLLEVHGLVAAGDLAEIVDLIPKAEEWGREMGAKTASVSSHPAWARLLRASGYEPHQLTVIKDL